MGSCDYTQVEKSLASETSQYSGQGLIQTVEIGTCQYSGQGLIQRVEIGTCQYSGQGLIQRVEIGTCQYSGQGLIQRVETWNLPLQELSLPLAHPNNQYVYVVRIKALYK